MEISRFEFSNINSGFDQRDKRGSKKAGNDEKRQLLKNARIAFSLNRLRPIFIVSLEQWFSEMESWKTKESVVAKLMGLDEPPPQEESIQKKNSVFSESYLRRVASIRIRNKRSFNEYRSVKTSLRDGIEFRDSSRIVQFLGGDEHLDWKSFSSGSGWPLNNSKPRNSSPFRRSSIDCSEENTPTNLKSPSFCRKCRDSDVSLFREATNELSENRPMGDSAKDHDSMRRNKKPKNGKHGLNLNLNRISKEAMRYEAFRSKWRLQSAKSIDLARLKPVAFNTVIDDDSESGDTKLKFVGYKSSQSYSDRKDNKTEIATEPSEQLGSLSSIEPEDRFYCSSPPPCGYVKRLTPVDFDKEYSTVSSCYSVGFDSSVLSEEACHPSPISVLERPFSEDTMYDSEILARTMNDIDDLRRHLELLKSETYTKEPEMVVSSDDENEGVADDSRVNSKEFMEVCRDEESRKFSYLVDVLAEASNNGRNLMDFSLWHALDRPISPSVFEDLEKKYGDRTLMKRSTRRLLFDRMNVGLTKILLPCIIGVHTLEKPVSKRVKNICYEEELEEVLWELLVDQEKECSKHTAQKMLESELGRLELGDEISAVVSEISRLLFEELLGEFF